MEETATTPIDVVFPLGKGSVWENAELRYALRALEANFLDLGQVWVVGHKPEWLTGAIWLDVPDKHRHSKDANLIDKLLACCHDRQHALSPRFVRSSDDELIILPSRAADLRPYHARDLKERLPTPEFWEGGWKQRLRATARYLKRQGFPTLHFDTHLPKLYDRELFQRIMASSPYAADDGFCIDTLYCNQAGYVDPPLQKGFKATFEKATAEFSLEEVRARIAGKRFLGYNDAGLSAALKTVLQEMFPQPSRFEADGATFVPRIVAAEIARMPTVVSVVGPPRSGTSCIAGLLHHLGIAMGEHFSPPTHINPTGFFEALRLREICLATINSPERVQRLRQWAMHRAQRGSALIGGKHPALCGFVPEMVAAWPQLKVIAVERPVAEIVASMERATWYGMNRREMESHVRKLIFSRDLDLDLWGPARLSLHYGDVLADPAAAIRRIVAFTGAAPSQAQIESAVKFVDPALNHHALPSA